MSLTRLLDTAARGNKRDAKTADTRVAQRWRTENSPRSFPFTSTAAIEWPGADNEELDESNGEAGWQDEMIKRRSPHLT